MLRNCAGCNHGFAALAAEAPIPPIKQIAARLKNIVLTRTRRSLIHSPIFRAGSRPPDLPGPAPAAEAGTIGVRSVRWLRPEQHALQQVGQQPLLLRVEVGEELLVGFVERRAGAGQPLASGLRHLERVGPAIL